MDEEQHHHDIRREPTVPEILRGWLWLLVLAFMLTCGMMICASATGRAIVEMWKP